MSLIRFNNVTELTVVTDFDEATDNITGECQEVFQPNEEVDVTLIENDVPQYISLQFGDGSVAFGVQRECFTIVKE